MKTLIRYISLATVVILSMTSCEDVIQVKLDSGEPILTIDAFVNNLRQNQKVRLTYTGGYFSQVPNPGVSGASVKLTDITSNQVYSFSDNGNGDYTYAINPGDTIAWVGHNYRMDVVLQGVTYTANTHEYRTTSVDSIDVKKQDTTGFNAKKGYECKFIGIDPVGDTVDYYWVKAFKNGVFYGKGSEINISENAGGGEGTDGLFFIPPIARGITPFGESYNKYDVCRVEIHSISRATFDFLTQVQNQTTNSGLFATTPENVKTNFESSSSKVKVVGWFNMATVKWREKVVQ